MKLKKLSLALMSGLFLSGAAMAAVSPEEAAKLGKELTPTGAEMAGNAAGTIPAWSAEPPKAPASFTPGDGKRPSPWADEKATFVISKANMAEYADQITEGAKALLEKYGDDGFVLNVYPTHRSLGHAPDWVYEATAKNATALTLSDDGLTMPGYETAIPFPIPKNGLEVIRNHTLRWGGTHRKVQYDSYYLDKNGNSVLASSAILSQESAAYLPEKEYAYGNVQTLTRVDFSAPARRAGEKQLVVDPVNFDDGGRKAWQYLKGQRRVRLAPQIAFDTPNAGTAGISTYDDAFMFNGSTERYNWTLVGKKEMYIPYNNNKLAFDSSREEALKPKFVNPDVTRWELHRVWVVEADLKEGERHIYKKRRFYIDEDSWGALAAESYDVSGQLWRAGFAYSVSLYDIPAQGLYTQGHYDLLSGIYYLGGLMKNYNGAVTSGAQDKAKYYSPQGLTKGSMR